MVRIWLLRHGSSSSNEGAATANSWEIPLTATGNAEAREAVTRWATGAASRDFQLASSPMLRARQTAEYFRVAYPQVAFTVIEELREFDPYDFSHMPAMRPEERRPLMQNYWQDCDPQRVGDGARAESFASFVARVDTAIERLSSSDTGTLAVCHGGVIKLAEILSHWRDVDEPAAT